jgi:hypothetical protein
VNSHPGEGEKRRGERKCGKTKRRRRIRGRRRERSSQEVIDKTAT